MRYPTFGGAFLCALAFVMRADGASGQETKKRDNLVQTSTTTIEVLGLERWTLAMLDDSLRKYAGHDLRTNGAHACAATLRYQLGFPDAAAIMLPRAGSTNHWLVTLTEPQDSHRVRYRMLPLDTTGGRPEWADMRALVRAHEAAFGAISGELLREVIGQHATGAGPTPATSNGGYPVTADTAAPVRAQQAMRAWLVAHRTPNDYEIALRVLRNDSNMVDRTIALTMILPHLGDDRTWTAIAETLIESDGPVRSTGLAVFEALIAVGQRPKSMDTILPAFHAILSGTSQIFLPRFIPLLLTLKPTESHAVPLLKNGGSMLLAYAGSRTRIVRDPALALLRMLSGKNYGRDIAQWSAWVASLSNN